MHNPVTPRAKTGLFVYGTLQPDGPNAHVLYEINGIWQHGEVKGRLISKGWGAEQGFPGLVLDAAASAIKGQVLWSDALPDHWARLDAFEGEEYQRVVARLRLENDEVADAWVYALVAP